MSSHEQAKGAPRLAHGAIVGSRGETGDPVQAGDLCVKPDLTPRPVYNDDRLTTRAASAGRWLDRLGLRTRLVDKALGTIAAKFLELRDAGLARTIANRTADRMPRGTPLWDGIREDTIFVPNTFGPARKAGDIFGVPRYEAANTLLDDGYYDNLSGQQAYKCFACRVTRA